MKRHPSRIRGLMIYELMLGLTLLATFAAGATYLMRSSLRVTERADGALERGSRFDNATEQLRRDVWGAAKLETPDGRTVRIERDRAPAITWTLGDAGTLTRTVDGDGDGPPRDWRDVADGVTFEADGGGGATVMLVEPPDMRGGAGRRMPFTSQVIVARQGGTP